jgi:thiol-disulfide isomerase/thioredoxin
MKTLSGILLLVLLQWHSSKAQNELGLFKLKVKCSDNTYYDFSKIKNNKGTVFIFFLTDCPASQSYTLTYRNLIEKYNRQGIKIYIVFPGTFADLKTIGEFCKTYKITDPVLIDSNLSLTKYLHATIAPECFLMNNNGKIIYQGRIDDLYYSPGRKRKVITSHDLEDAIKNCVAGKIQMTRSTKAIGCIINY